MWGYKECQRYCAEDEVDKREISENIEEGEDDVGGENDEENDSCVKEITGFNFSQQ